MTVRLFDTSTRTLRDFIPLQPGKVLMYNCGPTVYNYAHIGNLRAYVFADILRRTLEADGLQVKQVINITDIGHLVGDGDEGEDKMTAALKREGRPLTKEAMREVGDFYTDAFVRDLDALNIKRPALMPKASDHIAEDIILITTLLESGAAYTTHDGIYFDTTTFPTYPDFAKLDIEGMQAGARVAMGEKKSATDFALWKLNDVLGYDAPFGKGFPGWHIECSAMIQKHLGHPIDIHTGGVDHIPVHHTNEIAQSESAYGAPFVKTWMHSAHMTVDGEKMSKSLGNTYTLQDLTLQGIAPLAFRYWLLTASYRTQVNFTWEALGGAQTSYNRVRARIYHLKHADESNTPSSLLQFNVEKKYLHDDIDTPSAISTINSILSMESVQPSLRLEQIKEIDEVLGLQLFDYVPEEIIITPELALLLEARKNARSMKNYPESDRIRDEIKKLGYEVKDAVDGQQLENI